MSESNKIVVNGKQVTLRERLPAARFHGLLKALRQWDEFNIGDRSAEDEMGPYVGTVTTWEFEGDPEQLGSWLQLDAITEWPPLLRAINQHLGAKFNAVMELAKN